MRALSAGLMTSSVARDEPGPQERRDHAAPEGGMPREHRQQHAVEQADEDRERSVDDERQHEALRVEGAAAPRVGALLSVAEPAAASRLIVYQRLPWPTSAVEHRERRHRDAAGDAAVDAGRVRDGSRAAAARGAAASPAASCSDARAREGAIGAAGRSSGTASSCSCGSTSRNQPTAPATKQHDAGDADGQRWSPGRRGAASRRTPCTSGHAVGAGTSIVPGRASMLPSVPSAAHHVDDEEHDDPHRVDEVPVQREHLGARGVRGVHVPARARAPARSSAARARR